MNPFSEPFSDRREEELASRQKDKPTSQEQGCSAPGSHQEELDQLEELARALRSAPAFQVEPDFARRLEQRVLTLQVQGRKPAGWFSWRRLATPLHLAGVVASALLCLLVLGIGVLLVAGRTAALSNLPSQVSTWVQGNSPTSLTLQQAQQEREQALDQLTTLSKLITPEQAQVYGQAIQRLDQHMQRLQEITTQQSDAPTREQMQQELQALKAQARRTLWGLLPRLPIAQRASTTQELARLGEGVPTLSAAWVTVSPLPREEATISLAGSHLPPQTQLLINERLVAATGVLRHGLCVFVVDWSGQQAPQILGILAPDGTVAQTKVITYTVLAPQTNATPNRTSPPVGSKGTPAEGKGMPMAGNGISGDNSNAGGNGNSGNNGNGNGKGHE